MRTIGLVGGMTWHSTAEYYSLINRLIEERIGSKYSAKIILYSFDFNEIFERQFAGDWDYLGKTMEEVAEKLINTGADFIVYTSGTIHKAVDKIKADIPILDIRDTVGEELKKTGINNVGLLGTSFTMSGNFFKGRLKRKYNIKAIVPPIDQIKILDKIIFEELASGIVKEGSKVIFDDIVSDLKLKGAQGIILGCTELHMLIQSELPGEFYDSMKIHAYHAALKSLEEIDE